MALWSLAFAAPAIWKFIAVECYIGQALTGADRHDHAQILLSFNDLKLSLLPPSALHPAVFETSFIAKLHMKCLHKDAFCGQALVCPEVQVA